MFTNTCLFLQSEPKNDIDMLMVKIATKDESLHIQANYNLEEHKRIVEEVETIILGIVIKADEYGVYRTVHKIKSTVNNAVNKAYTDAVEYNYELLELQQGMQNVLNAIVRFLRETQIELPLGEKATLPEICLKIRQNAVMLFEQITNGFIEHLKVCPRFQSIEVNLPGGEVLTPDEIISFFEEFFAEIVKMIKQHESLDVVLEKLSDNIPMFVEKFRDLTDIIIYDADYLYKETSVWLATRDLENFIYRCIETIADELNEFANDISTDSNLLIKAENGSLEIELPFTNYY